MADATITLKCNNNCIFCPRDVLSDISCDGDIFKYLERMRKRTSQVTLTGGEVTIMPEFLRILQRCSELGFVTSIITNARMLSNKKFADAVLRHVLNFGISVYSTDPSVHDRITQVKGSLDQSLMGMRNVLAQAHVWVNVTVSSYNCHTLARTISDLADEGVYEFLVISVISEDMYDEDSLAEQIREFPRCNAIFKGFSDRLNRIIKNNGFKVEDHDFKSFIPQRDPSEYFRRTGDPKSLATYEYIQKFLEKKGVGPKDYYITDLDLVLLYKGYRKDLLRHERLNNDIQVKVKKMPDSMFRIRDEIYFKFNEDYEACVKRFRFDIHLDTDPIYNRFQMIKLKGTDIECPSTYELIEQMHGDILSGKVSDIKRRCDVLISYIEFLGPEYAKFKEDLIRLADTEKRTNDKIIRETAVCGNLDGRFRVLCSDDTKDKGGSYIFVTNNVKPYHIDKIIGCRGVIQSRCSFSSHGFVLCRELKKPILMGFDISKLKTGDIVTIKEGLIYRDDGSIVD